MRSNAGRGLSASGGTRTSLAPSFSSISDQKFFDADLVENIFQARLGAVGAVAMVDVDAHDGVGDLGRIGGLDDDAGLAREILVAGDAAEHEAEPDARFRAESVHHLNGLEADVVGVLKHRNNAAAVEADVELCAADHKASGR